MSEITNHDNEPQQELPPIQKTPEQKTEIELSPEAIEAIMAKVQDIDSPGLAYHLPNTGRLDSIFENGILGQEKDAKEKPTNRRDWAKKVRKNKREVVFFNITGRGDKELDELSYGAKSSDTEIANSYYVRPNQNHNKYVILFNLSGFKEKEPNEDYRNERFQNKSREYRPDLLQSRHRIEGYEDWKDTGFDPEKADKIPFSRISTEYGYFLSYRVAQRYFEGIAIKPSGTEEEQVKNMIAESESVSKMMLEKYKGKENLLIPIYDVHGNLLWPKQMNYEEVKKFVAERDAQKEST